MKNLNKKSIIFCVIIVFLVLAGNLALGYEGKGAKTHAIPFKIAYNDTLTAKQTTTLNTPESDFEAILPIQEKTLEEVLIPLEIIEMKKSALSDCYDAGYCKK